MASYGASDSSLIFGNQCMLILEGGVYCDFEDLRDDPEDGDGDGGDADKRPAESDDEED